MINNEGGVEIQEKERGMNCGFVALHMLLLPAHPNVQTVLGAETLDSMSCRHEKEAGR